MPHVKAATDADYGKAAHLLETIRSERPDHWPHGLSPDMFDPGDLFLIRKRATEDPVGFVGWQERQLEGQRVGLYSIGVLPGYRHQGIAKEAVSRVLCERAQGVDRVAALVAPTNLPSQKLARSLGVPLLKSAAHPLVRAVLKRLTGPAASTLYGGLGNAAFFDYAMAPGKAPGELPFTGDWSDKRKANTVLNAIIGAGMGLGTRKAVPMLFDPARRATGSMIMGGVNKAFLGTPIKDVLLYSPEALHGVGELPKAVREMGDKITGLADSSKNTVVEKVKEVAQGAAQAAPNADWKTIGAATLIAGALGGGAYALQKAMKQPQQQTGKMRVTLPTRNPGDSETSIELPFDQSQALSNNLKSRLELDTRRRLYAETQERIRRRKGQPAPAFPNLQSRLPELEQKAS